MILLNISQVKINPNTNAITLTRIKLYFVSNVCDYGLIYSGPLNIDFCGLDVTVYGKFGLNEDWP